MTSDSVIMVGWNRPVVGRETKVVDLFSETIEYFAGLKSAGTIDSFEPVLLNPHGGNINGFFLIRGQEAQLHTLFNTEQWKELQIKAAHNLSDYGVVAGVTGNAVQQRMTTYRKVIKL